MVDLVVGTKDLKKGISLILAGRKEYVDQDTADFIAIADSLKLCSTGTSTEMDANVVQAGYGRVPLPILKSIKKVAGSFRTDRVRVKIEAGRLKIETFGFSHPDIELKRIGTRIADLPVNASVLDALAMQKLYSAEELAESGLAARVLGAQERAIATVERATRSLEEFEIPRAAVAELVEAHVLLHAKALKAAMGR